MTVMSRLRNKQRANEKKSKREIQCSVAKLSNTIYTWEFQ